MFLCALLLSVYHVLCKLCSIASLHEKCLSFKVWPNKTSRNTTVDRRHVLLNCYICTDWEITLMLQLSGGLRQSLSSGCKTRSQPVKYSSTVQWENFREERVKSQRRGKLQNFSWAKSVHNETPYIHAWGRMKHCHVTWSECNLLF